MITTDNLYETTKIVLNDSLLEKMMNLYFSISKQEMNSFSDVDTLLYRKLNIVSDSLDKENETDKNLYFHQITATLNEEDKKSIVKSSGWYTFQSWHLLGTEKFHHGDIAHRFYIGMRAHNVYAFLSFLYNKFKEASIPFYFKCNRDLNYVSRRDNIVIYTNNDYLEKTLLLLQQLGVEHHDMVVDCYGPSELMGKINSWLGYATEYRNHQSSYTSDLCKIFVQVLQDQVEFFVKKYAMEEIKTPEGIKKIAEFYPDLMTFNESNIKTRLLAKMFYQTEPDFKKKLFETLKKQYILKGINAENICFDYQIKSELDQMKKLSSDRKTILSDFDNNSSNLAHNGMYITASSVYTISNNEKNEQIPIIIKNGKELHTYKPVYLFQNKDNSQFLYDFGTIRSSVVQKYIEQISKETLFNGMHAIALVLMSKGYSLDSYKEYIAQLLDGQISDLPEFVNSSFVPQCSTYRIYNHSQYSSMALYLEAAKEMNEKTFENFISNYLIRQTLYDMSFNHNGLAKEVERKALEYELNPGTQGRK